ncbi:MAG: SAM-dependent methyltransferase [Ruminococcaceae bacterium]|nr:SAM-dependent methyltransferase [Oscillospiraceae bacterium]
MNGSPKERLATLVVRAAQSGKLKRAVLSKSKDKSVAKATLTPKVIGNRLCLQLEKMCYADTADMADASRGAPVQAKHENIFFDGGELSRLVEIFAGFMQINTVSSVGGAVCEYKCAKSGKEALIGEGKLLSELDTGSNAPQKLPLLGNDRKKNYILSGEEEFFKLLGISDKNGRVHDKKQAKFRQINRFLELLRDTEDALPSDDAHDLHICDLCCGKSYLSFAVYYYFTAIRKRKTVMIGVDMKADVVDECNRIARTLGMDGLSFVAADITLYEFGNDESGAPTDILPYVDMVISLHACDTATDMVLDKASKWGAKVILSTPCCHHELNKKLNCPALGFIAEHSMLRQKLCDAATDALRLELLRSRGYDVAALELIDPEETPKNILLRGILKFSPDSTRARCAREEYEAARAFLLGQEKNI